MKANYKHYCFGCTKDMGNNPPIYCNECSKKDREQFANSKLDEIIKEIEEHCLPIPDFIRERIIELIKKHKV